MTSEDRLQEFWNMVEKQQNGCWIWTGNMFHGYGYFKPIQGQRRAHRISWVLSHGPIPNGLLVLHKNECHNPACVNPEHLYLGTHKDNHRDMLELGTHSGGWNKGISPSEKQRKKISAATKEAMAKPEVKAKLGATFGRKHPPDCPHCLAVRGKKHDAGTKAKMSAKAKERMKDPDERIRRSKAMKRYWAKNSD